MRRTLPRQRLLAAAVFASLITCLAAAPAMAAPPSCAGLADKLEQRASVKSATSSVVVADQGNPGYCLVQVLYGKSDDQNINVIVALPLSAADGGRGGMQGAWNGRTQGVGGGGCSGVSSVNSAMLNALKAGYVTSGTDLGHVGGDCEPGVNEDGTYNMQFIQDFIRNALKQQILLSKAIAANYYRMSAAYNYWNGCSTGGRQGYLLAQELPDELDGILANAPAIYWTRFQTAQMWGQIVMKDMVGGPIDPAKLTQAAASAVQACDANDGVVDGVIDDPRTCKFKANENICGRPGAPTANCLTPREAAAVNKIWDGPRNRNNDRIWFGLDRGTSFALSGPVPFALGVTQFHWNEHDRTFDWKTVSMDEYPRVAQHGSRNIAGVTDTVKPLDGFRAYGGKLLTFVGGNDQLIYPRGVINYYREMAVRYSRWPYRHTPDYSNLQKFYRLFRAPGVGHCGGGAGPTPVDAFGALVDWVEHNKPPKTLLAAGGSAAPATGRTRPLCPYPQTAIYNGSGDINDASSFHCGRYIDTRKTVCNDVLLDFKHEVKGRLDFESNGLEPSDCPRLQSASN